MKISYKWIKELVDIPWTPEQTAEKLAELGFPAESIQAIGVQVSNVISVKINAIAKHPNADRLQIATVTDGKTERSIVCGAPNIAVGQIVPLALPGAKLPGGIEITVSKIRGVESGGMLCSERELGLSEEHAGILQLPKDSNLGVEIKTLMGGDDVIMDIEITPNRPDLMSHIGVARELAAASRKTMKSPVSKKFPASKKSAFPIHIENKKLCSYYSGKIINGVRIGPSPSWMAERLKNCGVRPINNVVDITNYVLLEWGHPLHAFDLAKLDGPEIRVRNAQVGESFAALDERTYKLTEGDLVISDKTNAVAMAGVMGGEDSGVTEVTTDILLESALFDSVTVRKTSKYHSIRTESSVRFEKGTDLETAQKASSRATQLIQELAGGTLSQNAEAGDTKPRATKVVMRAERLEFLLGQTVPGADVTAFLKRLDLAPTKAKNGWACTVPSFRHDILEEVDLVEEVARMVGYNSFPTVVPQARPSAVPEAFETKNLTPLRDTLKGFGLTETITNTFCPVDAALDFSIPESEVLTLANPLSKEETALRPVLAINLLKAALTNQHSQREAVQLFEIGKAFQKIPNGHKENHHLGLVIGGFVQSPTWQHKGKPVDIYYIKGIFEELNAALHLGMELKPETKTSFLHPHQSFEIIARGQRAGWCGLLHPSLASKWGFDWSVAIGGFDLNLVNLKPKKAKASPINKFPFVERDIAAVVDKNTLWSDFLKQVHSAAAPLLVDVYPFDVFEGGALAPTQKSLAFRIRLQDATRTLTDADINGVVEKIKSSLQKNCGATLR